jgi:NTE family protein
MARRRRPFSVRLALQGGGAHGAFTWGVLDALLEDGLRPEAVSGTSAGAMNAVAMAQGWMEDGRDGARAALRRFWTALGGLLPVDGGLATPGGLHLSPALRLLMLWSYVVSPAQVNPLGLHPLRDLVQSQFDFDRLRRDAPMRLHIAATHADSGVLRLFGERELHADVLLASACLPTLFPAPLIDGEPYWDGGYAANPAVFPLLEAGRAGDVLLVLLAPLHLPPLGAGPGAHELHARIAEIAFTASFRREMQDIARRRQGMTGLRRWWPFFRSGDEAARARFHLIEAQPALDHLPGESRLVVSLRFFETLHDLGRETARQWLAAHRGDVGRRESVDLAARFG